MYRSFLRLLSIATACTVLSACGVTTVVGSAAGAAISITGTVVSTGVSLTGKAIGAGIDVITPSSETPPAPATSPQG